MPAFPVSRYIFYPIPWYSFLIVTGAALAIFLAAREERLLGLEKDTVVDLALFVLPFGIIGARLYYVLFSWKDFRADPVSALYIWRGGLAIYGGIIAGLITVLIFCRRRHLPFLLLCDMISPGLALAQGIGRWGNYFNMEAYGAAVTDPWFCFFPLAVLIPEGTGYVWHIAAFFLESCWDILIFLFLLFARRRLFRSRGDVFFSYALLYSAGRLVIEETRTDSLYSGTLRVSQVLSFCAVLIILVLFLLRRRGDGRLRAVSAIAFALSLICAVPAAVIILHVPLSVSASLSGRIAVLSLFSAVSAVSYLIIYGKSSGSEVIYARHKD